MMKRMRHRTVWDWRLKLYPLIVIPMMVYLNAAPQESPAGAWCKDCTPAMVLEGSFDSTGPEERGVNPTPTLAVAAPVQGVNAKGAAFVWERNPKYPLEEFVMILTNERR